MTCAVIVMAKAPTPGYAKTRLIPALGAEGAARLAEHLLEHAVTQAVTAAVGVVDLCCTPDASHPAFMRQQQRGVDLSLQGDGDLGDRMRRALDRWIWRQGKALLIGTDAPALDAAMLQRACRMLDDEDAVFVPALDGGYALVGLKQPAPQLFSGIVWSTPRVMQQTRERLLAAGLRYGELPPVADIDEAVDLAHAQAGWYR